MESPIVEVALSGSEMNSEMANYTVIQNSGACF
jgi:hypothetical protein